jgi:hypothetical protein
MKKNLNEIDYIIKLEKGNLKLSWRKLRANLLVAVSTIVKVLIC